MYTVWHVDKYKITPKLVTNWTNEILYHIVVFSGFSRPGMIDARARNRAAARRLRNTALKLCIPFIFMSAYTFLTLPAKCFVYN